MKIAVGPPSRAEDIATFLDESSEDLFRLTSERAFLTITGHYKGVPVSVVSIGMGSPNMDFVVREVRECVQGDLLIVRCVTLSFITVANDELEIVELAHVDAWTNRSPLARSSCHRRVLP